MKIIALIATEGKRNLSDTTKSIEKQTKQVDEIVIASEKNIESQYKVFVNPYENGLARNTMQALVKIWLENRNEEIYIATLDDDDTWHPEYIERVLSKIEKGSNFISSWMEIYEDGSFKGIEKFNSQDISIESFIIGNPGIQGSNKTFSLKIALESGGMIKHINSSTDRALNINLLKHPDTVLTVIQDALVRHNRDNKRSRITNSKNKKNDLIKFYSNHYNYLNGEIAKKINERHKSIHGIEEVVKWK